MLVDPCNLKDIKINKGKEMKQRKFLNTLFEVIGGIMVLGLLFLGFKVWDPISKYDLAWLKTSITSSAVEDKELKTEEKQEVEKKEITSTSRFKVEYESKASTGGVAGVYVVTDKATNQKYIGLHDAALTPLK